MDNLSSATRFATAAKHGSMPARSPKTTPSASPHVGIVGLGRMGHVFAMLRLRDGNEVSVFDRNPERAETLRQHGARPIAKIADLGSCKIVLTSLPDDDALTEVTLRHNGLIDSLRPAAIHVSMSTVSPALSKRLADAHASRGQHFIAAPVLGNPDLAAREAGLDQVINIALASQCAKE